VLGPCARPGRPGSRGGAGPSGARAGPVGPGPSRRQHRDFYRASDRTNHWHTVPMTVTRTVAAAQTAATAAGPGPGFQLDVQVRLRLISSFKFNRDLKSVTFATSPTAAG
jgi:hypothetical protein